MNLDNNTRKILTKLLPATALIAMLSLVVLTSPQVGFATHANSAVNSQQTAAVNLY